MHCHGRREAADRDPILACKAGQGMGPAGGEVQAARVLHPEKLRALAGGAPRGLRGRPGHAPDHERLPCTFGVVQRTAAVNRTLQLRASETTRGQARREAFLRRSVVWLEGGCLA